MKLIDDYLNQIVCGDCLEVMRELPSNSIDLVVTPPPHGSNNSNGNREYCNHCGASVSRDSGKFINRVPDFNDILTRINNNLRFPFGDFVCDDCDNNPVTDND